MKKLTENQKNFMKERFFKNEEYAGWSNIADALLETGTCIVPGDDCIWKGGIGNFIKTTTAEDLIGCVRYNFDLSNFVSSEWFKEYKSVVLDELRFKLNKIDAEMSEINAIDYLF